MSRILNLPSGATATVRATNEYKQKDRQKVVALMNDDEKDTYGLIDGVISLMVTEWTIALPLPSLKPDSLGELDIADYDFLSVEAEGALKALFPRLNATLENEADPKAITENSKG